MAFLEKLYELVDKLKENDNIFLYHFFVNPPDETEILETEKELGYELFPEIVRFYKECNGFQLVWTHKKNQHIKDTSNWKPQHRFLPSSKIFYDIVSDGVINIAPIRRAFLTDWYESIYFDFTIKDAREQKFLGNTYIEPDFSKRIKPFDLFSEFNDMAFFLDGSSNPPLIMGDDHQACYTDSHVTDFETYLEFVLYSYGSKEARRRLFGRYNGFKYPFITKEGIQKLPAIDINAYDTANNNLQIPFEKNFWGNKEEE